MHKVRFFNFINDHELSNFQPKDKDDLMKKLIKKVYNIKKDDFLVNQDEFEKYILICTINDHLRIKDDDAAIDLSNIDDYLLGPNIHDHINRPFLLKTGVKLYMPVGISALVLPRSSSGYKYGYMIPNSPGLIDASYRGDVGILINIFNSGLFSNLCKLDQYKENYLIPKGTRLAQLLFIQNIYPSNYDFIQEYKIVLLKNYYLYTKFGDIFKSDRGEGGFGSTGS